MALTDAQIRGLKPETKRIRKSDGGGMFLEVLPSGKKIFRLAYRFDGKQRTIVIGDYPHTKLADARLIASEHKQLLRSGIDPHTAQEQEEAEKNAPKGPIWRDVAMDYLMLLQRSGAARPTLQKMDRQIGITIEQLGDREITDITAQDVLSVVNPIAESGKVESAHEIRTRFSQIFRYAAARGLVGHDPASVTIDAMIPRTRGEFAA